METSGAGDSDSEPSGPSPKEGAPCVQAPLGPPKWHSWGTGEAGRVGRGQLGPKKGLGKVLGARVTHFCSGGMEQVGMGGEGDPSTSE